MRSVAAEPLPDKLKSFETISDWYEYCHFLNNYFISELTLAELKFGVENREKKEKNF